MMEYANTLKGVALYTLDTFKGQQAWIPTDGIHQVSRAAQMAAYANVLKQVTGRNVRTEEKMVREIIELIPN